MHRDIHARLATLRAELEAGQKMMADLNARRRRLRDTLIRIEGAIMVLEELAGPRKEAQGSHQNGPGASETV